MENISMRILFAGAIVCLIPLAMVPASEFKLGIENFSHYSLASSSMQCVTAALVTNHTAKDQQGRRTIDILWQHPSIKLMYILTSEHGITGKVPASVSVEDGYDAVTKIPIVSLYKNGSKKEIPQECLQSVQVLFFDMQDCGMRHYTYISTLHQIMKIAAEHNKQIVVLDRPNPLGGIIEGPLVENSLQSFISVAPIPLRYGLTIGELAHFFNEHFFGKKVNVCVIPMKGYARQQVYLPEALSPNIPSKQSCYGYSFLGLLGEVRPLDVGLGSRYSFRCIALPKQSNIPQRAWWKLAEQLKKYGIKTIAHTYTTSRKKIEFHGLLIKIPSANVVSSFNALLYTLLFLKKEGINLVFSPYFDKAMGTSKVREYIQGIITYNELKQYVNKQLVLFNEQIRSCMLYAPEPLCKLL